MSSDSPVRREVARLREQTAALRARPQDEVVGILGEVLDAWSDPDGHWQRELAPELAASSGFSRATVRDGLRRALQGWDGAALRDVVARELGESETAHGHELTSVLLAGCIPMPTLLQMLLVLAVRSPLLVKMASRDPVTARFVRDSVAAVDAELATCIGVLEPAATQSEAELAEFLTSPCVVASGSDETIRAVRSRLTSDQVLIEYGHKLSIAVIGRSALDAETAAGLARDVAAWDQLGCLSPTMAFVVAPGPAHEALDHFADCLADELEKLEAAMPRGAIDAASAAAIRAERETARLRFGAAADGDGMLLESERSEWTVVLEPEAGTDAALRAAPLHRFLRIQPVANAAALTELAQPLAPWLSTIGCSGLSDAEQEAVARLGGERLCQPGEMQTPELGWRRDGLALLEPILSK